MFRLLRMKKFVIMSVTTSSHIETNTKEQMDLQFIKRLSKCIGQGQCPTKYLTRFKKYYIHENLCMKISGHTNKSFMQNSKSTQVYVTK